MAHKASRLKSIHGKRASQDRLALLRDLARAWQAFEQHALPHIRSLGLTPAQFDVVATLGNTEGMSLGGLAEHTLIYKTTLTGVIDRLAERGLVERVPDQHDRRSTLARLTPAGETLFAQVFPAHRKHLLQRFERLDDNEAEQIQAALQRLREIFAPTPG